MTDIQWRRRRSKWPYVAALGCLFALTVAAPRTWHRARPEKREQTAASSIPRPLAAYQRADAGRTLHFHQAPTKAPELAAPIPTLPPLAEASSRTPAYAGPMAVADDYVVVADNEGAPWPHVDPVAAALEEPTADEAASAGATAFSLRPPAQSVLVRHVAPPAPAARPLVSVATLIQVRDALAAVVREAKIQQARITAAAEAKAAELQAAERADAAPASSVRVRVDSPDDRLAMRLPRPAAPTPELAPAGLPSELTPPAPTSDSPAPELAESPTALAAAAPVAPPAEPVLRRRPDALIAQLESLWSVPRAADWAQQVLIRVDSLVEPAPDETEPLPIVQELAVLAQQGFDEAQSVREAAAQAAWLRTARALERRLPVWGLLAEGQFYQQQTTATYSGESPDMLPALQAVADATADSAEGAKWREYLRLNDLAGLTSVGGVDYVEQRRATAREVLMRLQDPWLSPQQRAFLAQPAIEEMARALEPWASGEASLETLAAFIEQYESTASQRDATALAELRLRMKWSDQARLRALAEELNRHYRNANVRMALSGELMNRLIPPQPADVAPVHSRIAGTDVRGRSETQTQIHVRLLPDPAVWRFGLEAHGKVNSQTRSLTWPARLRNSSQIEYEARKLVMVNRYGMHVWPAEADADGNTNLVGVDSTFGSVPILGALIESAAREQHRLSRPRAVAQVRSKVREQACERMDREADAKLAKLDERLHEFVLEPIQRFGLTVEPLDMHTTDQRASMRLRMASEQQLGAHTPRPSAPSDSLASFQLHESVFNNALRGLELDGRRLTAIELREALAEKFRRRAQETVDELPKAAKVEFAAYDAIRVICHDDRIELVLNIRELRHGRDHIRGVGVHAFFRPEVDGLDMKLVRDGSLQFSGAHLRTGPRMVLHSIFGKLLPKDQEIPVLVAKLGDDARFKGLMITQLVIDDGWVAVSLGPERPDRVVWRTHGVERR
ncbi:MAG: hypothetical protein IT424_02640 [Pirellulales bacterium]|nr:hypothetical protein [Pirellulales bacterium]